jgi:tungstate transport system ATP-binding protein
MKPVIALKDILVQQGDKFRLGVESLELLPRRIYALTGPNGAGKSTLLRIMALLITPQRGRVSFAGGGEGLTQQRQNVTLVEQTPYLLDSTVSDNLAFGLKLRGIRGKEQKRRISAALDLVGLAGFEGRKTRKLSGGEIQRVALARALVLKPQLLLLDEPTSNIDAKSLQTFESLLARLPDTGVTVVFSTHDLSQPERLGAEMLRIENGQLLDRPHPAVKSVDMNQLEKRLWLNPLNLQGE